MTTVRTRTANVPAVRLLSEGDEDLQLKKAILLYESQRGGVYATVHAVEMDAINKPSSRTIGPGVALSKNHLAQFASAVSKATAYAGFVPSNLLYTAPNTLAWWLPPSVRKSWFKTETKAIGVAHGDVAHPALVFIASADRWYVFALRDSTRPMPNTRLCHAPHFNVYEDGLICTGNVKTPEAPSAETITDYEDAFFRSHFTHSNHDAAVKFKGGATALWAAQLRQVDPAAMAGALKDSKETLQTAISRIANKQRYQ